jgi:hypothetical protein
VTIDRLALMTWSPAIAAKRSRHHIVEPPDGATGALAVVAPSRRP